MRTLPQSHCSTEDESPTHSTIQPNDGQQILQLFGAEVIDLARHLAVDVAGVDHQDLALVLLRLVAVEEPQFAGHGAGVEEIRADGDHRLDGFAIDQFLTHLRFIPTRAGCLRRHDESSPTLCVQVTVKITDPQIIAVGNLACLVHARQTKRKARVILDLVRVHFVHVEGRVRHHKVGFAEEFVRVFVITDGFLNVAFQPMHGEVHLGKADGGVGFFSKP